MTQDQPLVPLTEELRQAYEYVQLMQPRADFYHGACPMWYGWALREAYLAGMRAEREACESLAWAEARRSREMGSDAAGCHCENVADAIRARGKETTS